MMLSNLRKFTVFLLAGIFILASPLLFATEYPSHNQTAEVGVTELIGINEQVAQNQYAASVEVSLPARVEITKVCLYATEDGSGAILTETGTLLVMDADPATSAADAALAAAEYPTILAQIDFADADWHEDTAGAVNCVIVADTYHETALFLVFFHSGATQWNSAAGDDEQLEINLWYKRD